VGRSGVFRVRVEKTERVRSHLGNSTDVDGTITSIIRWISGSGKWGYGLDRVSSG
jgi:hypothetical protein